MLTHQDSLKESICEKMFPITYIKIGVAPRQLLVMGHGASTSNKTYFVLIT